MTNTPKVRSILAQAALDLAPPLIRRTLLEDSQFRAEYDLSGDAILSFGDSGILIPRSDLFGAIRKILSGELVREVADIHGVNWELKTVNDGGEFPSFVLSHGGQNLILPSFMALSPDQATRLHYLDKAASDVNLPSSDQDTWRDVLTARPLQDDEVDLFLDEFRNTPVGTERSMTNKILGREEISISSLVPSSRRYYERLVGSYDGSTTIRDYAANTGKKILDQLSAWQPYEGFLYSLLLSSHSTMTGEIRIEELKREEVLRVYDFLNRQGDRISQLGAVEVGFRILTFMPEIEPTLVSLIRQIRDDDVAGKRSGFNLLSSLFFLVDSELSRLRLFSAEPPFYRRLAALSQAALIHRQILNSVIEIDHFSKWAYEASGGQYYIQSLVDMRLEPRWSPDYGTASQLKADFFGRIMMAAKNYEQNIKNEELYEVVLGTKSESLPSLSDSFRPFLPGPLEGTEQSHNILPVEIAEAIERQLSESKVGPSSFVALVNSALIFQVGAGQAELAARALKLGNYTLANIEDIPQLLAILHGLATVAAVTRSPALADELRILVRRYRRDAQYALFIEDVLRICLVATSSRADLNEWLEFTGDCLTELAFGELDSNEAEILYSYIQHLCHIVPELWISSGRADAALLAYNASHHLSS